MQTIDSHFTQDRRDNGLTFPGHDVGRNTIDARLILFLPIPLDAVVALPDGPFREQFSIAHVVIIRDGHPAGGLHQVERDIEDLAPAGQGFEQGEQLVPFGVVLVDDFCRSVQPQDQRRALESAEHEGHAWKLLDVGGGFIAAAGEIEPRDAPAAQHPEGVHTLGGHVHPAVGGGGADEEQLLLRDEFDVLVG
jgi:hypothetical protein